MRRTSRNSLKNSPWLIYGGVVCVLVVGVFFARSFLTDISWRLLEPVLAHNPVSALTDQLTSKAQLAKENNSLRAQLASTTASIADRNVLYAENLDLKSRLGRDGSLRTILAGVLQRPPGVPYDTLIVDAGSKQGAAVGDFVSAGGTSLVGTLDSVTSNTSRVVLLSAPGESYPALLAQTPTHASIPVTVEGQGGGSLIAEVPAHTAVVAGDAIVFPGFMGGLAATVSHVEIKEGASFETLYMHLPVNPLELRFVEVLKQ